MGAERVIRYTAAVLIVFLGISYLWLLGNLTLNSTPIVLFAQPIHYVLMTHHIIYAVMYLPGRGALCKGGENRSAATC
jgi:hypothetical protein